MRSTTETGGQPRRGAGSRAGGPPRQGAKPRADGGQRVARRRLTSAERRAAILEAALEVFAARGYHAASIDEIAHAAGVSKALIYEHFPSKRDLHFALLESHVGELFGRLAESAATSEPGEVRLRAGVEAFLAFVEGRREAFRMLFRDAVEPDVADAMRRVQQQAAAAVAGLIASEPRERPEGESDEEAIAMLAQLLTGAVQSLAIWWDDHRDVPRELLVDRVMDFAWLGFERLRAGERFAR
ncbi:MAG TPA: TetR/AcrR family transcriptional regulator [Thermoleophilaceae bacterium]